MHSELGFDPSMPTFRLSPLHGQCIGQASNPGPVSSFSMKATLANPTAVHGKADVLLQLQSELICLSETSATKAVQCTTQKILRKHGYSSHWSAPAEAHQELLQQREPTRGKAVGTSIHSKFPLRAVRLPSDLTLDQQSRLTAATVQVGDLQIMVIAAYGFVSSQPQARRRTADLLQIIAKLQDSSPLPCMIFADFNHDLATLEPWHFLREQGYQSTSMLYESLTGAAMPPTFEDSTCHDQVLVSPLLCSLISRVHVRPPGDFHGHKPVQCCLTIPHNLPKRIIWRVPKPLHALRPDADILAQQYATHRVDFDQPVEDDQDMFHTWSTKVEQAVNSTLKVMHLADPMKQPFAELPRTHAGRCHRQPQKRQSWHKIMPTAWAGQYDTSQNCVSHSLRSKIRQLRRVQSLIFRVRKMERMPTAQTASTARDLELEWMAIVRAKGFQPTFAHWLTSIPEIQFVPAYTPDLAYLTLIEQFLRFEVESQDAAEAKHHRKIARYQQWYDRKHGHQAQAFRQAREPGLPPVTSLMSTSTCPAVVINALSGLWTLRTEHAVSLGLGQTCSFAEAEVQVCDVDGLQITVMPLHVQFPPLTEGLLQWESLIQKPAQIACSLEEYWNQFWQRDDALQQTEPQMWADFQHMLQATPTMPACRIDALDVEHWLDAIRRIPSRSTAGICGWLPDDLKTLPKQAVEDLAKVCHRYQQQHFPMWLLQARTVPFRKSATAEAAKHTRPITILSLLYRVWSRVTTHQIAQHWRQHMPQSIIGFLPGRSAARAAWTLQWRLEQQAADHSAQGYGGLTLDLIKAFNTLPRIPCQLAMQHYGVPNTFVRFWKSNMDQVQRHWQIHAGLQPGSKSTTGAPEGDSWSVVAMLAMGAAWAFTMAMHVSPTVYADNFNWSSPSPQAHKHALQATTRYAAAASLQIDWSKTYVWGSHPAHRQAWKSLQQLEGSQIRDVALTGNAAELGYQMHYRLQHSREVPRKRHQAALKMLSRLERNNQDVDRSARVITAAVWPKALFGAHLIGLGDRYFRNLRTAATKCMVTGQGQPNPFLAVTVLSRYSMDPVVYVILEAVRTTREALIWMDNTEQQSFFRQVSTHSASAVQVHGPAGALAYYLAMAGLRMTSTGCIERSAMAEVHILITPWPAVKAWLKEAWAHHMPSLLATRKDWGRLPPIDLMLQHKLLAALPMRMRLHLAKDMTGSYLVNSRKQKFDEHQSELCEFCQEPDSLEHRIMHCRPFDEIRAEHTSAVQFLSDFDPHYIQLPLCHISGMLEVQQWRQSFTTEFQWPSDLPADLSQCIFFTDGSCVYPEWPTVRSAAFAIVLFDPDRLADNHGFRVLGSAECSHRQSINRAELQALVVVAQNASDGLVVSDSQYALQAVTQCKSVPDPRCLHRMANSDLLTHLWHALQNSQLRFKKIKSHLKLEQAISKEHERHIYGNSLVDAAAQAAVQRYRRLNMRYADMAEEQEQVHAMLAVWYFRYDLMKKRAQLSSAAECTHKVTPAGQPVPNLVASLKDYQVPAEDSPQPSVSDEFLRWSLWGTSFTRSLWQWFLRVRWPAEPTKHRAAQVGVTWLELAMSYIWTSGRVPPVNRGGRGKKMKPCTFPLDAPPTSSECSFTVVTNHFRCAVELILKHASNCHPAWFSRAKLRTHYYYGAKCGAQGLKTRPMFPHQKEVISHLQRYFQHMGPQCTWHEWPDLSAIEPKPIDLAEEDQLDFSYRHECFLRLH